MDFMHFKDPVAAQFNRMAKGGKLFRVDVERDLLWDTYLKSFPAGTDPVFRKRTEHDCSCCRSFIKNAGSVVSIEGNRVVTIFDGEFEDPIYAVVARVMADLVRSRPVCDVFLHYESSIGTDKNFERGETGDVTQWRHFYVQIPVRNSAPFVQKKDLIATKLGAQRALHDVLLRSLTEFTPTAVDTVLELNANKSLYRGDEQVPAVRAFKALKAEFDKINDPDARDLFVWSRFSDVPVPVSKIRNTAIGTLLEDLSADMDLELAVSRWEKVMAPTSYKRPTALVTQKQVEAARAKVTELGLGDSLRRRFATLRDISVNDVIFRDRDVQGMMKDDDPFSGIQTKKPAKTQSLDKIEVMPVEDFIEQVIPKVSSIEVLVENKHLNHLVSLIAPSVPGAGRLFKWPNDFSWAYHGDVTDSIKERVKQAGGNVTGDLCCRLAWHNHDDLDFHMKEPKRGRSGGYEIYYGNRSTTSPAGGRLDVDMNAGTGTTREPVENIFYAKRSTMTEGTYELIVHQFSRRENRDPGFEVEMDYLGQVTRYAYEKVVNGRVLVCKFEYTHRDGVKVIDSLSSSPVSKSAWGVRTQDWTKVSSIMLSPNYWGEQGVGNKHYMFMLEGCKNDGTARGFFNEFLRPELDQHRKVIEIVGSKSTVETADDQLSGLGFSSTQRNELLVRVRGTFNRTVRVQF